MGQSSVDGGLRPKYLAEHLVSQHFAIRQNFQRISVTLVVVFRWHSNFMRRIKSIFSAHMLQLYLFIDEEDCILHL